jgi:hypothetical protein
MKKTKELLAKLNEHEVGVGPLLEKLVKHAVGPMLEFL